MLGSLRAATDSAAANSRLHVSLQHSSSANAAGLLIQGSLQSSEASLTLAIRPQARLSADLTKPDIDKSRSTVNRTPLPSCACCKASQRAAGHSLR